MNETPDKPSHDQETALIRAACLDADALASAEANYAPPAEVRSGAFVGTDAIPGYKILREIHRGGQGVVYQAVQLTTKQTVAVKVMREGAFGSDSERLRFEREQHILAQLDHPRIVGIRDSGSSAGHHYFVMDYISGQALDRYVNTTTGSVDDILELFAKICEAVNAAHLQGVIHRDLKPSNIRVDANGEPHILDFGLAKVATAEGSDDSGAQVMSITGQFIGSLPWASPEQARGLTRDIDIRTDTYSLGVILYQLLTKRFPYQVVGNMQDVLQNICNVEPTRPRTLCRQINDEIETIILKCLSKDRDRRYQTAGELARDTRHYLAGEPIEAKRDSGWYVIRKTLKRHKVTAIFVGLLVLLSVLSGVTFWMLFQQASSAEQRASHSRDVLTEMVGLMELLEPGHAGDHEKLEAFMERLESNPLADPEVEGLIHEKIGKVYKGWSDYAQAAPHLEKSLAIRQSHFGTPHGLVAQTLHDLGSLYWYQGHYERAQDHYQQALDMRRELFGEQHEQVAATLNDLAACYDKLGDYDTYDELFDEALQMRLALLGDADESKDVASMINNMGVSLYRRGQYAQAAQEFQRSLRMMRKFRDDDDTEIIQTRHNLARCLTEAGDLIQAQTQLYAVLDKKKERLGKNHVSVARSQHALALVKYLREELGPAERYCRQALDVRRSKLGDSHRATAFSRQLLGRIELARGDVEAAIESVEKALKVYRRHLSDDHWRVMDAQSLLGECLARQGQWAEAEDMLIQSYQRLSESLGAQQWRTVQALERIIDLYDAWGKPDETAPYRALLQDLQPGELPEEDPIDVQP